MILLQFLAHPSSVLETVEPAPPPEASPGSVIHCSDSEDASSLDQESTSLAERKKVAICMHRQFIHLRVCACIILY